MADQAAEPATTPDLGTGLGVRLRQVRTQRGMSVRELARRAGCSASLVSQIERGVTAPSARIVYALANELAISLDYLFGEQSDRLTAGYSGHDPSTHPGEQVPSPTAGEGSWGRALGADGAGILQRADDRNVIDLSSGVRWERLTPVHDRRADFLEVVYAPFGKSSDDDGFVRHDGREYLLVLHGEIIADVGFESYHLYVGDSLAFDPATPHRFRNPSADEARCMQMVFHPE